MRSDNTHHLLAAAQRRRDSTLERAQRTLRELSETDQRYTVTDLAARAGVSRAWLYAQAGLRDQIRQLTDHHPTSPPTIDQTQRSTDASLRQRLTLAHARIIELDDDNRRLRNQVAQLHGQLRATRLHGPPVVDTVHNENNLVTLPNDRTDPR
ncbi:DUF6262 family protein [Mycolicibacterium llatzerense]|uniref:DUF6262 family protein n=1 Tax=Mycolicibacterium llatzerense TaxID=280871 RepID=UPI0021B5F5EE|nr:DUF6262 family protein [Mycolicibacterium llatzerense]MCT7361623.1 transposase [Mycolicibacterium llatzerense]